jgi:hypothetical protein
MHAYLYFLLAKITIHHARYDSLSVLVNFAYTCVFLGGNTERAILLSDCFERFFCASFYDPSDRELVLVTPDVFGSTCLFFLLVFFTGGGGKPRFVYSKATYSTASMRGCRFPSRVMAF